MKIHLAVVFHLYLLFGLEIDSFSASFGLNGEAAEPCEIDTFPLLQLFGYPLKQFGKSGMVKGLWPSVLPTEVFNKFFLVHSTMLGNRFLPVKRGEVSGVSLLWRQF